MSEIRSILQGLVGKIATVRPQNKVPMYENRDLSLAPPMFRHKYASINFGRFCGDNLEAWIFQAEHYFEFYEIIEKLGTLYSEGNNETNAPKVFDDLSERPTNANSIYISCKLSQLEVMDPHNVCKLTIRDTTEAFFPNDLAYSVSPSAEATDRENDVKSEDKNDEEEIVTIRDGKVYPQHGLGLAQCWKKLSSIPSTCSYPNLITRRITSRLVHDLMSLVPCVSANNVSKIKIMIYGSLNDIIRWFTLLDTSQIITHICHAILYKVMKVQKLSKSDRVNSAILKAANKIIILFLMVFTCSSQGNYNTPSCQMKFPHMNLEDKVLFEGESIVVNQIDPVRAYGLLECFIWDPDPFTLC
ncbi:hypothetical protein MTR67_013904 [Solanum verrucosum]|uniref:Uncharacterized protein n=1 Tax=Solanum verrucosum TaxID=315347 RepID=A0AAF0QB95_SOLVR|nr:hypothetical protein MTR67_013904 [Solanum verrucosum]